MSKFIGVAFLSKELKQDFEHLAAGHYEDKELFEQISKAIEQLRKNPYTGIDIQKNLWPKYYEKKYVITNLRKVNLREGWRLMYTIEVNSIKITSIILEWLDHKSYERRFKY
jgi:hypothetical protein